jgi:nucleoid-associated protein YgaU
LAGSTIGIKIADGSYYPVLEEDFTGSKRLTLTTVKDGQDRVQIDLYRGEGHTLGHAQYVGSLVIENIPPVPQGEPEIELILGIDAAGELTAEASDRSTGESQVFTTGIRALAEGETYEEPEFEVEPEAASGEGTAEAETENGLELEKVAGGGRAETFDEVPLTGDAYPVSGTDRRRAALRHRAPGKRSANPALVAVLVVLAVVLLAAIGYIVWRLVWGPPIPSLSSLLGLPTAVEASGPVPGPAPAAGAAAAAGPAAPATAVEQPAEPAAVAEQPAAHPAPAAGAPAAGKGVTYRIKRGDTLWDISSTYYRNPWLYPVIATANGIRNPDLIIAGARIFIPEQ